MPADRVKWGIRYAGQTWAREPKFVGGFLMEGKGGGVFSRFGVVTIEPQAHAPGDPRDGADVSPIRSDSRYIWQPTAEFAEELPQGFRLAMKCLTAQGRTRRFAPENKVGDFILQA